jgi:hypothetical protein
VGRVRSYRQRVSFEMRSVRMKSLALVVERALRVEFGCRPLEAEVLARVSVAWLPLLGLSLLPGRVRLEVPLTRSRRHSAARRGAAVITAVDAPEDTWAWQAWGVAGVQRVRVVRWLLEVRRSGGWASLSEVAAWASLSPSALAGRLRPARERGVWLPHVGGAAEGTEPLGVVAWALDRFLEVGSIEEELVALGLPPSTWANVLAGVVLVRDTVDAPAGVVAARVGWSEVEVTQVRSVMARHPQAVAGLVAPAGAAFSSLPAAPAPAAAAGMRRELVARHGFSELSADLYLEWLTALAERVQGAGAADGEVVVFAIDAREGARAKLSEASLVPVRLSFFTDADARLGPKSEVRTRVSEMKFARIERFAKEARAQGALLTLPDLAVLLGIHVDTVRHHLLQHPDVVVPTRGRMRDIGRGVTHKAWIVELYLQMHSVTEIVERTQHSYESVEAYLRDFVRIMTLADRGLNRVMIRRVSGRSLSLVNAYLDLYHRYDRPEHHFRLSQLRLAFTKESVLNDKKGGRTRSRTEHPNA